MSLSKHFKSSTSFQPKEIVRDDSGVTAGWHAAQSPGATKPFQNQQVTTPLPQADQNDLAGQANQSEVTHEQAQQNAPGDVTEPPQTPTSEANDVTLPPPTPTPSAPAVDLSNYIEIAVAEEQQNAAYQKGLQEGAEKLEQDFGSAAKSLLIACQQLDTIRETLIHNSVEEIQEFILSIAEKIIRSSVVEQDSTIIATIEETLQRAVKSDEFYLYVHPEDYAVVTAKSEDFVAGVNGLQNIVIKEDPTIERGGVKIESENCTIDATISSQFEMIREAIKKNM